MSTAPVRGYRSRSPVASQPAWQDRARPAAPEARVAFALRNLSYLSQQKWPTSLLAPGSAHLRLDLDRQFGSEELGKSVFHYLPNHPAVLDRLSARRIENEFIVHTCDHVHIAWQQGLRFDHRHLQDIGSRTTNPIAGVQLE